jgi:hypothetical protein
LRASVTTALDGAGSEPARDRARIAPLPHPYSRQGVGDDLPPGKPHDSTECGCGATFEIVNGRYCCSARRRKGVSVCSQSVTFDADVVENVFLDALEEVVASPRFIDQILDHAFAHDPNDARLATQAEHDRLVVEVSNLTKGIAAGGNIQSLTEALRIRDDRLRELQRQLARPVIIQDREVLKAALELRSADWRGILRGPHIEQARQVLRHLIDLLPIQIHNKPKPAWLAAANPAGLARGLGYSRVASPTGFEPKGNPVFEGV